MILIEHNPKDLFATRLAVLTVEDDYIVLTFDENFAQGRGKVFRKNDSISKQYFTSSELSFMKRELKINRLPYEIYNEYSLQDVYDFMRK